eukprot:TRINITY_DN778111_c0_g1_i1.p1 TRINITY_DN778111_c0_g1~~TRINITY_DN778111_c0_g1_i1.p1  ORF type:complete len:501 (-),score=162.67 TRINITY_DN778111_c0_g1_i1:275-1777(-)
MAAIAQNFEAYQKAKLQFVQFCADSATRPQNIEMMQNAGVMALLRPLLLDTVPSIQQTAAMALGRLANYSDSLAEAIVANEILPQLVYSLGEQNRFYKKAAAFVLRAVAKHSPELAQAVVDAGATESLVKCLEEFDPSVKEAAAWALGYIAGHCAELAQAVVDAGAVPLLVLCVQEPEVVLKRITASALSDIAKHSPELAQSVVDAGAVAYLAPLITHDDPKLKRQVCSCLAQVSKHSVDLAEVVVEAEIFPKILLCLKDIDSIVRRNATTCIREIAKHTPELSKLIVNAGGAAALVDYVAESQGNVRLPGIMALGYISGFSETLALAVIVSKGVNALKDALLSENEDHIKAATVWTLGQIGRHTPDHAKAVANAGCLQPMVALHLRDSSSSDLKVKAKRALKGILLKCTDGEQLAPLLKDSDAKVQKYVLSQYASILPNDAKARKAFMQTGLLQRVQEIKLTAPIKVQDSIAKINSSFPAECVKFSDPSYAQELLKQMD